MWKNIAPLIAGVVAYGIATALEHAGYAHAVSVVGTTGFVVVCVLLVIAYVQRRRYT